MIAIAVMKRDAKTSATKTVMRSTRQRLQSTWELEVWQMAHFTSAVARASG